MSAAVGGDPAVRPRPDLRLLAPAVGGWVTAAWALGAPARQSLTIAAVVGALGMCLLLGRGRGRGRAPLRWAVAACLVCVAGCLFAAGLRVRALGLGPLPALARTGATAELTVVVTGDPRAVAGKPHGAFRARDLVVVPGRAELLRVGGDATSVRQPVLVLASGLQWSGLLPSQRVTVSGRLSAARRGDLISAVLLARGPPSGIGPPSLVQRAAGSLRGGLRTAAAPLGPAERGLVPGLVDGDVSGLDPALREDFRTTGLTHLTAVSGSNVAIVLSVSLLVARRLRAGPRLAPVLAAVALVGFVILARPDPSVLRAAVMGAVGVAAVISGRQRAALPTLCAAVLLLLLLDPGLARSAGFALSVLATGGLLVLAPGWRDRLARHLPRPVAEAIAIPAAAQLACGPVIAVISAQVSLVSVPANLLAAPAVAPATVLGVLAALAAVVWMPLARLLAWLSSFPTGWLVVVARRGARVPAGAFGWPGGLSGGLLLAAASGALLLVVGRRRLRRPVAALGVGATLSVVGLQWISPAWPPPGWAMVACDVGQGDGLVVSVGAGSAVVIDTGPDPAAMDHCLRTLGVRRIPLLVLTHLHADHVEGVPGVLRGRVVEEAEIGPLDEPPDEHTRLLGWLAAAGVPVHRVTVGEQREVGPAAWTVLAPQAAFHGTSSDPNNSSLVLRLAVAGFTVLLTGDVEWQAQRALLSTGADVRADVLKVPHHGSDHQDPGFLDAVGGGLAITSVGKGNSYGHPSPITLDRVRGDGMRSYRTDADGDVALVVSRAGLSAVARHGRGSAPTRATAFRPMAPGPPLRLAAAHSGDPGARVAGRDIEPATGGLAPALPHVVLSTRTGVGGPGRRRADGHQLRPQGGARAPPALSGVRGSLP